MALSVESSSADPVNSGDNGAKMTQKELRDLAKEVVQSHPVIKGLERLFPNVKEEAKEIIETVQDPVSVDIKDVGGEAKGKYGEWKDSMRRRFYG